MNKTPKIPMTAEQKMRGGPDPAADWIFIVCGYDLAALKRVSETQVGEAALIEVGAEAGAIRGFYTLSTNTRDDVD